MSGGMDFNPRKFDLGVDIAMTACPWLRPDGLAWFMYKCDMEAYLRLGKALTGATYLRGREHPEVAELGNGWFTRRVFRAQPAWAKAAGLLAAAYVVARA